MCIVCFVCMRYMWMCGGLCVHCCMCAMCLAINCVIYVVCVLLLCACWVWLCYMCTWCVCGYEYVDIILPDQNSKLPILIHLPKKQLPYCILVSDIIFNLFSLCSILFTFLRISTEMWQRINFFIQTALNQSVPLTGSLFLLILNLNNALRLNNTPPWIQLTSLKEVKEDRHVCFSPEDSSPTSKSSRRREDSGCLPSSGQWEYLPDFRSTFFRRTRKVISTLANGEESKDRVLALCL